MHDPALPDSPPDPAVEALLRAARPTPSTVWSAELERSLLPARSRSGGTRLRVAVAALSLAAVVGVVGLAGAGPLAPDGNEPATARPGCELVYVTEVAPVGEVVRRPDGTVTVETTDKPVTRERERCR